MQVITHCEGAGVSRTQEVRGSTGGEVGQRIRTLLGTDDRTESNGPYGSVDETESVHTSWMGAEEGEPHQSKASLHNTQNNRKG